MKQLEANFNLVRLKRVKKFKDDWREFEFLEGGGGKLFFKTGAKRFFLPDNKMFIKVFEEDVDKSWFLTGARQREEIFNDN